MALPYATIQQVKGIVDEAMSGTTPTPGGSTVIPNPTIIGTEPNLLSIQIDNNKFKVPGQKGDKGDSGTITVGTVTTGSTTSVTNVGTSTDAIFNFVLQKGPKGDPGSGGTQLYRHNVTINDGSFLGTIQIINKSDTSYTSIGAVETSWTSFAVFTAGYLKTSGTLSRCPITAIRLSGTSYKISYIDDTTISSFSVQNTATVSDEVYAL